MSDTKESQSVSVAIYWAGYFMMLGMTISDALDVGNTFSQNAFGVVLSFLLSLTSWFGVGIVIGDLYDLIKLIG